MKRKAIPKLTEAELEEVKRQPDPYLGQPAVLIPMSFLCSKLRSGPSFMYIHLLDRCQNLGRPRCKLSMADAMRITRRTAETTKKYLKLLEEKGLVRLKMRQGESTIVTLLEDQAIFSCSLPPEQRVIGGGIV